MANKLTRWLNSKQGKQTLMGVLAVVLIIGITGQLLGWWAALADLLSGTVLPPQPTYPAPPGGYTCLPSCADGIDLPQDGQFLRIANYGNRTFAGQNVVLWISVPGDYTIFELGFFDGDSGKDDNGNLVGARGGNWDESTNETVYTLYADPLRDGSGSQVIGSWYGNATNPLSGPGWTASAETMPNNGWYTLSINVGDVAKGPSGHYFYRLEATQPAIIASGGNSFKVRSSGYLSTGQSDLVDASFAIMGAIANINDARILYPQFQSYSNLGPSTYNGEWRFYLYLPNEEGTMEFWDGDFDFGAWNCDPNNPNPDICNTRDPLTPRSYLTGPIQKPRLCKEPFLEALQRMIFHTRYIAVSLT